jgi:hypothetical protein
VFQIVRPDGSTLVIPTDVEHRGPEAVEAFIRAASTPPTPAKSGKE